MVEEQAVMFLLPKGTIIHVSGWPVELSEDTAVTGHPGNIELIKRDQYLGPRNGLTPSSTPLGGSTFYPDGTANVHSR